jgi:aspartyl protease family protein
MENAAKVAKHKDGIFLMSTEPHNGTKGIGRGMLTIAWIIVLVLLTLVFGTWERQQINPNQQPDGIMLANGIRQVTLEANRYHHYISSGIINEQEVVFLLDTGATDVVVPASLAKKLGLKKGPARHANTANGVIQIYATRIHTLQLGSIVLKDVRASINPHMDSEAILLGMSALKQVELVQSGDTLTLRQIPVN